MTVDVERVKRMLGAPELDWLVQGLRKRFERGGRGTGRLRIPEGISSNELEALNRLLGRRLSSEARSLTLSDLEYVVTQGGIPSLRDAIQALTGTLKDRREERLRTQAQWNGVFSESRVRLRGHHNLLSWLEELERTGVLRRRFGADTESAKALLLRATEVALLLPASGASLAEFAASTTGDSHALDHGTALGNLVLRAATKISDYADEWDDSEGRRALWESVGVFCDELSASVLVLNLRADQRSLSGVTLSAHADAGEPCRLTLRELLRHPPEFGEQYRGRIIYVCENPSVLAHVADRLGENAAPMICIEGKPRTPAARLLRALGASGAQLRYHGDFDWEGIRIANFVTRNFGTVPWRMATCDYEAISAKGLLLSGEPVPAEWDQFLAPLMANVGKAVHEEAVLETLCADVSHAFV